MAILRYLMFLVSLSLATLAHRPLWAAGSVHRAAVVFDFACATPDQFPASVLTRPVQSALAQARDPGLVTWGDRAVAQDLSGDAHPEYLVPLHCGATGNCTWGIFGTRPTRQLGTVSGARLQVSFPEVGWAKVAAYSSLGAGQGLGQVFELRGQRYVAIERREVAGPGNDHLLDSMGDPKCTSK